MATVLIIGAGGVGQVVAHKCAQVPEVFSDITLASRTESKCKKIAQQILEKQGRVIKTAQVDADKVPEMVALILKVKPQTTNRLTTPSSNTGGSGLTRNASRKPVVWHCLAPGSIRAPPTSSLPI